MDWILELSPSVTAFDILGTIHDKLRCSIPHANIVHDRYHISAYLGKAVDLVRRKEHRALQKDGNELLTGAKYLFLKNTENHTKAERARFRSLMHDELKVGRAWTLKEAFRHFFQYDYAGAARKFFTCWYFRATHSRLKPMIDVAKMMRRHLSGLLAYCSVLFGIME